MRYDFSYFNIFQLLEDLTKQTVTGVEREIIKLFDDFVRYSMDTPGNTHLFNGWKTNSCYKVGKKVIVPWFRAWTDWGTFNPENYDNGRRLYDIEKVFDLLDGKKTDHSDIISVMRVVKTTGQTWNIRTKYFDVSFFKKGTMHLVFLNDDLLKKFNLFGSQRKNWLPPSYGKKAYRDMDDEERAVVDSFEGRESYESVMRDKEYFFVKEGGGLLMLSAGEKEVA
jgi:hypothetical protein